MRSGFGRLDGLQHGQLPFDRYLSFDFARSPSVSFINDNAVPGLKSVQDAKQTFIEEGQGMLADRFGNAVVCFRDAARNGSECVTVSADADGITNGILKRGGLEERHQRLGDGILACFVKLVAIPDAVQREVHRIIMLVDVIPNFKDAAACSGHIQSNRCRFCALQAFRMIMGHLCYSFRHGNSLLQRGCCKATGAYTHRSAVTIAVVRLGV